MFSYELESYEVKGLPDLLKDYLGPTRRIIHAEFNKLPQHGYGSVMIKTTIKVKNEEDGKEEIVNAVAKVLPPDPAIRKRFQIEKTYKNELNFYKITIPAFNKFRKGQGVDEKLKLAPKFFGGRLTIDGDDRKKIDEDAVIILEDLAVPGFQIGDRTKGFDLDLSKMILEDLSKLHGTGLALKLTKPDVFKKVFLDIYDEYIFTLTDDKFDLDALLKSILNENETCKAEMEKTPKQNIWQSEVIPKVIEPWATITHNDCWVNNTMQRSVNGKIVENKIIDYQIISYRSLAHDVFYYIWTSVQFDVLKENIDFLLKFYHEKLVETLKELKCDTSPFSYENFLQSIREACDYEFGHTMFFIIITKSPQLFEDFKEDDTPTMEEIKDKIPKHVKDLLCYMYIECLKRKWI